jgi:hypothetical protein
MTTNTTGTVSPPRTDVAKEQATQVAGTAKDQAVEVAGTAKDKAADVAGTAKDQAAQVVGEAADQTRQLVGQAAEQLNTQATEQTQRLTDNLRQVANQLHTMAGAGEHGTTATSVVREAATRTESVASYLDGKQPGDLISDLQGLGRRRPGAFLLGAAVAGFAIGRVANAARKASTDSTPATTATTVPAVLPPAGARAAVPTADVIPGAYPSGPPLVGGGSVDGGVPGTPTVEPYPAPLAPPASSSDPTTPPAGGAAPAGGW